MRIYQKLIYSKEDFKYLEDVSNLLQELRFPKGRHTGSYVPKDDEHGEILPFMLIQGDIKASRA